MKFTYKTKVNNTWEYTISPNETKALDLVHTSDGNSHLLHENTSYHVAVVDSDFNKKTYNVKVNGNPYHIKIEDELDILIAEMGFAIGAAKHINEIKAPMPGLILDIMVTEGAEVKENDPLLILEAMKMENIITSPRTGIIKSIYIIKGAAVDKNALLMEFE